jgi:hypothetical protein
MSTTKVRQQGEEQPLTWLSSYSKDVVFNREHDRMRVQHAIVRATMQDRVIYAPVNATAPSPELHILDSACNDGTWMLDVITDRTTQLQVQPDIKLNFLGTDLDQKHFSDLDLSSTLPSNVSIAFQVQDISQPWPDDLSGKFDLVHQRFALQYLGDSDENAQQAVARLVNLVQPGTGWVQLGEANVVGWAEGGNVDLPALRRGKQMTEDFCAKLNINTHSFQSLGRWLKEAAAIDVEVKEFAVPMGGKTELGRKGLKNLLEFLATQKAVTSEWERFEHSGKEYDDVMQELVEYFGNTATETLWPIVVAWGRRPAR